MSIYVCATECGRAAQAKKKEPVSGPKRPTPKNEKRTYGMRGGERKAEERNTTLTPIPLRQDELRPPPSQLLELLPPAKRLLLLRLVLDRGEHGHGVGSPRREEDPSVQERSPLPPAVVAPAAAAPAVAVAATIVPVRHAHLPLPDGRLPRDDAVRRRTPPELLRDRDGRRLPPVEATPGHTPPPAAAAARAVPGGGPVVVAAPAVAVVDRRRRAAAPLAARRRRRRRRRRRYLRTCSRRGRRREQLRLRRSLELPLLHLQPLPPPRLLVRGREEPLVLEHELVPPTVPAPAPLVIAATAATAPPPPPSPPRTFWRRSRGRCPPPAGRRRRRRRRRPPPRR